MASDLDNLHVSILSAIGATYGIGVEQTTAIMHLSNALRRDPSVSEETRDAAGKAFAEVKTMLSRLQDLGDCFDKLSKEIKLDGE